MPDCFAVVVNLVVEQKFFYLDTRFTVYVHLENLAVKYGFVLVDLVVLVLAYIVSERNGTAEKIDIYLRIYRFHTLSFG